MPSALLNSIAREWEAAGLVPDPERQVYLSARMRHFGDFQYRGLLRRIGPDPNNNPERAIRLLGFGHVMTEFAIAWIAPSSTLDPRLLALGALANQIVSDYDGLIDSGHLAETILPRSQLTRAPVPNGGCKSPLSRLVNHYFTGLASLPFRHPHVCKTIGNAIVRMYDAETATAGPGPFSFRTWRRKSALPFVVMGLPLWMTVPLPDTRAYLTHVRWLHRLGQLIGWIDDVADLDADRAAERPNYFLAAPSSLLPSHIARSAGLLLEQWDVGAPRSRYSYNLRQTFLAAVWGWLGASYSDSSIP